MSNPTGRYVVSGFEQYRFVDTVDDIKRIGAKVLDVTSDRFALIQALDGEVAEIKSRYPLLKIRAEVSI